MLDASAATEVERYRKLERVERAQAVGGCKPPDEFAGCLKMPAGDGGKPKFSVGEVPIKPIGEDLCLFGCDGANAKLASDRGVKFDL